MIDAMKQALDYIKATNKSSSFWLVPASELNKTVTALRLAIEQAEKQEPVAWISKHGVVYPLDAKDEVRPINDLQPLYTAPRQPLTDEEIGLLTTGDGWSHCDTHALALFARAIERAHGIGGGE